MKQIKVGFLSFLTLCLLSFNTFGQITKTARTGGRNWGTAGAWTASSGGSSVPKVGENVIIPSGAVMTLNVAVTENIASLTIQSGGQLIIQGSNTIILSGNFTNNGSFIAGLGTVTFSGTAGATQIISGTTVTNFNNITVTNGTALIDVQVTSPQELSGVLSVNGTARFDVTGTNNFTLLSLNDNPVADASIASLAGGGQVTGDITVQRYISQEGRVYRYMSSPVSGMSAADWQDDFSITGSFSGASTADPIDGVTKTFCGFTIRQSSPSMYSYSESTTGSKDLGWIAYTGGGFGVGEGFAAFVRESCYREVVIDVTGTINQGNKPLPVTFNGTINSVDDGWNLVGNPYPSAIRWNTNGNGWVVGSDISTSVQVPDNISGGFVPIIPGQEIASGQAFWVKANGPSHNLTIQESAKVVAAATTQFYRVSEQHQNYLKINLSNGLITDIAYYRVAEEATSDFDNHDLINYENELFDVTTKLGSYQLAVNSVASLSCGDKVQVHIKDMKVGSYSFSVSREGIFQEYEAMLKDKFTGTITNLAEVSDYVFSVTSVAASKASDRFEIELNQKPVDVTLAVDGGDGKICGDNSSYTIRVMNPQPFVTYVAQLNGVDVSNAARIESAVSSLDLSIGSEQLLEGTNELVIKANNQCATQYLEQKVVVEKQRLFTAKANSLVICKGTSADLKAAGAPENGTYHWYETQEGQQSVYSGSVFKTPALSASTTYYVAAVNALDCEGIRVPVNIEVPYLKDAEITLTGRNLLVSNYTTGNQWYYNGQPISKNYTGEYLGAHKSGTYRVDVLVNGCITSATYDFIFGMGNENTSINLYPNPVQSNDELNIELVANRVEQAEILNSHGMVVSGLTFTEQDPGVWMARSIVKDLPAGVYYFRVKVDGRVRVHKFIRSR